MHLLAYGGTSYDERVRTGRWPEIPRGALEDLYGLPANSFAFGMGRLGQRVFLIFRERQTNARGGYPYTLLLDPEEPVWESFQWNAAALLLRLLGGETATIFHTAPEKLTAALLDRVLADPPVQAACATNGERFQTLWVAGVLSNGIAVTSPSQLGMDARPRLEDVAEGLQGVEVCFRPACGWLVGGSADLARAFGASLVIDDQRTSFVSLEPATQFLADWGIALPGSSQLRQWQTQPVFKWYSPDLAAEVRVLAELSCGTGVPPAELLGRPIEGRLAGDIEDRLFHRIASVSDALSSEATHFVLRRIKSGEDVEPALAARLDPEVIARHCHAQRSYPWKLPDLKLRHPYLTRVVVQYVAQLSDSARKGLPEFVEKFLDTGVDLAGVKDVVAACAARFSKDGELDVWLHLRERDSAWPAVCAALKPIATQRAQSLAHGWERDYAIFGDPSGTDLKRWNRDIEDEILRLEPAERLMWAKKLPACPLRPQMDSPFVVALARQGGDWLEEIAQRFLRDPSRMTAFLPKARDLFRGSCLSYFPSAPPQALDLREIVAVLTISPDDSSFKSAVAALHDRLPEREREKSDWREGRKKLGLIKDKAPEKPALASRTMASSKYGNLSHERSKASAPPPETVSAQGAWGEASAKPNYAAMAERLEAYLFGDTASDASENLEQLLRGVQSDALEQAIKYRGADAGAVRNFATRFGQTPDIVEGLMQKVGKSARNRLAQFLLESHPTKGPIAVLARALLANYWDGEATCPIYLRSMCSVIQKKKTLTPLLETALNARGDPDFVDSLMLAVPKESS